MFHLELDRVCKTIKEQGAKRVLIQLPDGIKPQAKEIADRIENETQAEVIIWFASCFGACDLPTNLASLKIDLMVQFGHNLYHKTPEIW